MNRVLIAIFTVALLCASLRAQSSQSPSGSIPSEQQTPSVGQTPSPATPAPTAAPTASTDNAPRIAAGSVIPVELTKSIDAKKAKKGDEVVAKVTQDLKNNAGAVIVPKDTKVIGHVIDAEARSKEQKESQVAIAFDHAVLKDGEQMQMPMSIQAIFAPPNRNPSTEQPYSSASPQPAGGSSIPSGRPGAMGGAAPQSPSTPPTSGSAPAEVPAGNQAQPQITGNTQGVVGIPNLKLSAAPDPTNGSVVSSEKKNVKLDDGTFLLLRVNQ